MKIASLLNEAMLAPNADTKVLLLAQAEELLLHKDAALLPIYLNEVLQFHIDSSQQVSKFVINFIEKLLNLYPAYLGQVLKVVQYISNKSNIAVQKRYITFLGVLYKQAIKLISQTDIDDIDANGTSLDEIWIRVQQLKSNAITLLSSDNDGLKLQVIKFIEICIIAQTLDSSSIVQNDIFSIDDLDIDSMNLFSKLIEIIQDTTVYSTSCKTLAVHSAGNITRNNSIIYAQKLIAAFISYFDIGATTDNVLQKSIKTELLALLKLQDLENIQNINYDKLKQVLVTLGYKSIEADKILKTAKIPQRNSNKRSNDIIDDDENSTDIVKRQKMHTHPVKDIMARMLQLPFDVTVALVLKSMANFDASNNDITEEYIRILTGDVIKVAEAPLNLPEKKKVQRTTFILQAQSFSADEMILHANNLITKLEDAMRAPQQLAFLDSVKAVMNQLEPPISS